MKKTKYIIQMTCPGRPDLTYFFAGNRFGSNVFELKKSLARRYDTLEEAQVLADIFQDGAFIAGETYTVKAVRCRT